MKKIQTKVLLLNYRVMYLENIIRDHQNKNSTEIRVL